MIASEQMQIIMCTCATVICRYYDSIIKHQQCSITQTKAIFNLLSLRYVWIIASTLQTFLILSNIYLSVQHKHFVENIVIFPLCASAVTVKRNAKRKRESVNV